jgi:hypothetical protein
MGMASAETVDVHELPDGMGFQHLVRGSHVYPRTIFCVGHKLVEGAKIDHVSRREVEVLTLSLRTFEHVESLAARLHDVAASGLQPSHHTLGVRGPDGRVVWECPRLDLAARKLDFQE